MSVFNVLPSGVNTIFPTFWKHPDALFKKGLWLAAYPLPNSLDAGVVVMRFILHALSALSEALTPLKHTGPWETLFPILLLESVLNFSGRDFSPTRNLITMRCSTLHGTFCSLITLATPRQDWTGSNPSRREGGDCGFTLSRSHSCCAVRLVYIQISPGHIWTTLYFWITLRVYSMSTYIFFVILCRYRIYDRLIPHPRSSTNCQFTVLAGVNSGVEQTRGSIP